MKIAFLEVINDFDLSYEIPAAYKSLKSYLLKYSAYKEQIDFNYYKSFDIVPSDVDVVGVSTATQNFDDAIKLGKKIREAMPEVLLLIGGHHITFLPETLPEEYNIGVIGEGELTFLKIIDKYISSSFLKESLYAIDGIVFHGKDNQKELTKQAKLIDDLDSIPFPVIEGKNPPFIFSSRGCPYKCVFCSSTAFWRKVRYFSSDYVINEIEHIIENCSEVTHITFWDDLVIANKKRFIEIVDEIEKREINKKVSFGFAARTNHIDEEMAILMKRMNVVSVAFGLESGSDKVLPKIKGNSVSVAVNQRALDIMFDHGFTVIGSFVVGSPGETEDDIFQTFSFIEKNILNEKIHSCSINMLMPLPGTKMWDYSVKNRIIKNPIDWSRFKVFASYRTSRFETPEDWIQKRVDCKSFYLNEVKVNQQILLRWIADFEMRLDSILKLLRDRKEFEIEIQKMITTHEQDVYTKSVEMNSLRSELIKIKNSFSYSLLLKLQNNLFCKFIYNISMCIKKKMVLF